MRPVGDVTTALLEAASSPCTVRQLCTRAGVGYRIGAYTASRMLQRGQLVLVAADDAPRAPGAGRPPKRVQAPRPAPEPKADDAGLMPADYWLALQGALFPRLACPALA